MTSNVGSEYVAQLKPIGFDVKKENISKKENLKKKIMESLKEKFRPEFLNRIDEVVIFDYLGKKEIKEIVDLELAKASQRLQKAKQIKIRFSEKLKNTLAEKGFDPDLGVRPLKRVIQRLILDPLSMKVVCSEINEGDKIFVDFDKEKVIFQSPQAFAMSNKKRDKVLSK